MSPLPKCCLFPTEGQKSSPMHLRTMAKKAVEWARKKGLNRINEVHGAEEFRVPTHETWEHNDVERSTTAVSSSAELEAGSVAIIDLKGCTLVLQGARGLLIGEGAGLTGVGHQMTLNCS